MANCNPPVKNQAFDLGFTLYKSDGSVIANPGTLTAKISKDFGDYADIGTTSEEDTTYGQMKAALTATEMNADVVMVYIKDDTSGCVPFTATIYTATGDAFTRLGAPAGASVSADVAAVKAETATIVADTNELQTNQGNWSTATGFSTHSAADVKTAMEAAGSHLTLIKTETDKLADTLEDDGGTYRFTENALEQAPSGTSTGATLEEIEGSTVLAKEATVEAVASDVDAVDAKVSALGASVVTVTSPVSVDASTVTLVCGDDYYDADGRALTFTDSGGTYPAFTAGTCKFTVRDLVKGTDTETSGTIVDANTVRFELTKTATGAWTAGGKYRFDVEVTLASGHEVTVATGVVTMLAKYSG